MIIHQCISGFTQNVGYMHGVMKLAERLRKYTVCDCHMRRVELNTWRCDWKRIAEYYWLLSEYHFKPLTVCIYGYSWGAGWGAIQLAKELNRAGIKVKCLVLSDPVYRHPLYSMRWMSLLYRNAYFEPVIHIPDNVEEVYSFYQTTNMPGGHKLIGDGKTVINPSIHVPNTIHQKMDDNWMFHALSIEIANRINKGESIQAIHPESLDASKLLT